MNKPTSITQPSFQCAWIEAVLELSRRSWAFHNLVIHIESSSAFDAGIHDSVCAFMKDIGVLTPKQVAYTIFPFRLYKSYGNAQSLFNAYNRNGGFFHRVNRINRRARRWGNYFHRMTHYNTLKGTQNQLGNIIKAITRSNKTYRAAYTILIQYPGGEMVKPLGGPCLNYMAVQMAPGFPRSLGLMAVYRNHDFLERAYGNYWGLCKLIGFLAKETNSRPGPLTCVSSHAFADKKHKQLKTFVSSL